ncbi:hypothetical protein [Microbulbifer halophilus]|uniref:Uncharacterized protein n=1 Tax=Microbulbifer halophilus TaxID=453963 RepID=A0ABW5EB95_9GAMM|nr:hypothetical protein [Microbulbifer halophilus]MCW8125571.1 hypothetical protein [Microbulbifer halophilus]
MTSIPASKAAISALRLEQRVERDVKAGIPELDRTSHTESEESIRAYVASEIVGAVHRKRQDEIDEQAEARNELHIRQLYQELGNTDRELSRKIDSRKSALLQELRQSARDLSSARADLEIFRHKNGLTRDAIYRESKLLHCAIIFFIVIFETALNAFFLSRGSELGLLGGFFQAFILSLVNLGLAAFIAFSLRNLFHVNILRKLCFGLLFVAISAASLYFVLGVGHYREALEADPFTASEVAVTSLWSAPWGIRDFNSWIMVIVSAIALSLLVAKFFVVDDRYPGYTAVSRRVRDLQRQWVERCGDAFDEIGEAVEESRQALSEKDREIRSQFIRFKASIERSEDIRREYQEDITRAQGLLDELVRYYQSHSARIMNRRAAYFGELLRFELGTLPKLNTVGLDQHREELQFFEQMVAALDREYAAAMDRIGEQWEGARADISAFIGRVERESGLSLSQ